MYSRAIMCQSKVVDRVKIQTIKANSSEGITLNKIMNQQNVAEYMLLG